MLYLDTRLAVFLDHYFYTRAMVYFRDVVRGITKKEERRKKKETIGHLKPLVGNEGI